MIEIMARTHLMTFLSVPVYIDTPADRTADAYVVIERTGGGETEHIRSATIAIQSYGASKYAAAELHEQILAGFPAIADGTHISACDLNAEYDYTDTTTKQYRYQAVYNIIYY